MINEIAILGGGNVGTLMAGEFAAKGHGVRLRVSDPESWSGAIRVLSRDGGELMRGGLECVSEDLSRVVDGCEYIWITYPTFMLDTAARDLLPHVREGQRIGVVPGACAEFFFAEHVRRGAVLVGLQRVHSIARVAERGCSVYMLGRKSELQVAALPSQMAEGVAREVESLFGIPAVPLPNYLVETLTPSNPILHTARIRELLRGWEPGVAYDRNVLFYEEWDDASSRLLLACDDELQRVCRALEGLIGVDLGQVKSLREHYGSPDAPSMTAKISGIPAFRGLTSPMKEEAPGRWVPDFGSRYFRADFAYGLKAIRDIAGLAGVPAPNMDEVYGWYVDAVGGAEAAIGVPATLEGLELLYG